VNWIPLDNQSQLESLIQESHTKSVIIFKHSTTCPISSIAKMRLEGSWSLPEDKISLYYLDLLKYRSLSTYIAETLQVHHESPQIIVLKNGEVSYDNSHLDISIADTEEVLV
jgi:bacillithiol system protein YtxJ